MINDGDGNPENNVGAAVLHIPGGACVDDAYEQDDVASEARPLAKGAEVARNFCFDGADWGSFEAQAGERLGLRLVSAGERVAIAVVPAGEQPMFNTTLSTESPGVPVAGRYTAPAAGTYHVYAHPVDGWHGPGREYSLALLPARSDPVPIGLGVTSWYPPPAGGVAEVSVDLRNTGFDMIDPITVGFVLSADEVLDAGDRSIDRQSFPALQGGELRTESFLVPIPPDVARGDWYLIAVVDPDDTLVELVEDDNVSRAAPLRIVAPECTADPFEPDDRPADAAAMALGVPQYRNHCEDAHDWARFDAAAGEGFTIEAAPDHCPESVTLRVIGPSGSVVAQAEDDYCGAVLTFSASETGVHRLEAAGDSYGDSRGYTLTLTRAQPDLTAQPLTSGALVPGGVIQVRADYENLAATPAGPFQIGLFLSRDQAVDGLDVPLGEVAIAGAEPYLSCGGPEVAVAIPADVPTGTWWLLAMADPHGLVPELDETNNVGPAPLPVEVTAPACAPDDWEQDDFPSQARPLPLGTPQLRNHCDDGRDWAAVTVSQGDPLAVRLDQATGSGIDVVISPPMVRRGSPVGGTRRSGGPTAAAPCSCAPDAMTRLRCWALRAIG